VCAHLAPLGATAAAPEVSYVALGDSYSSGEGNHPFDGKCHRAQRSDSAYPRMLPALVGYVALPRFHACTGATIADVWLRPQPRRGDQRIQLEYLSPSIKLVTLTIGGNDLGFAEIVIKCLLPTDCTKTKLAERVEGRMQRIKAELVALYARIRQRMDPDGLLVVAGYPRLFVPGPDADCKLFISAREAAWMNSLVSRGNGRIAEATRAARGQSGNVAYVDVSERFSGHELCSEEPWLYGIELTLGNGLYKGSYHPRRSGQQAYAASFATFLRQPAIRAALTG
jgi:lysophospholipase L1-like esterase